MWIGKGFGAWNWRDHQQYRCHCNRNSQSPQRTLPCPCVGIKVNGRVRYRLLGGLVYVGTWSSDDIPGLPPFDQGAADDFGDLSEDERLEGEDAE